MTAKTTVITTTTLIMVNESYGVSLEPKEQHIYIEERANL